ncbi:MULTISPECIES: DUF317 domain-containing protein [unclassified Streptomyces]|uniref:DUF317 domain-containing protein n=1 Tax=unclassified Streptomyces TaxID=2593676 RepID=UPI0036329916
MPRKPTVDAHVRLDTHPVHPTAVTAVLTGSQTRLPHEELQATGWTAVDDNLLVLARIDHEEPYWARKIADDIAARGITVEITPALTAAIDDDWTWPDYPLPTLTRQEIRDASDQAQTIHDDILHGRLTIHAHADDGETTVALGTYRDSGQSVHLHGQNHLRCVSGSFDTPHDAWTAFVRQYAPTMRLGPAPPTDTERQASAARTSPAVRPTEPSLPEPRPAPVPSYAGAPGDHDALLDAFLDTNPDWEKWRTWTDDTSHAFHENHTLRIERVHETGADDIAWTVAAYETPVSDRAWHLTATGGTPAPVLQALLNSLARGSGWDFTPGAPADSTAVAAALTEAAWARSDKTNRWTAPRRNAGVPFDAFAVHNPLDIPGAWVFWASAPDADRPAWSIRASDNTPTTLLTDLVEELVQGTTPHQRTIAQPLHTVQPTAAPTRVSPPLHPPRRTR